LLARAYLLNRYRTSRARYAACAAISHAALGRVPEATMWLQRARKNHPSCPLLARAEAALAAAQNASHRMRATATHVKAP
jgi:hypothetical protein